VWALTRSPGRIDGPAAAVAESDLAGVAVEVTSDGMMAAIDGREAEAARLAGPSDRELVLAFRPEARVESRENPRSRAAEYRVSYDPVPGGHPQPLSWQATEERAWRGACVRLGLRVRRATP
jgi:hypothetical protein